MFTIDEAFYKKQFKRIATIGLMIGFLFFYAGSSQVFTFGTLFYDRDTYKYATLAYVVINCLLILLRPFPGKLWVILATEVAAFCFAALLSITGNNEYIKAVGLPTAWISHCQNDAYTAGPLITAMITICYVSIDLLYAVWNKIKSMY